MNEDHRLLLLGAGHAVIFLFAAFTAASRLLRGGDGILTGLLFVALILTSLGLTVVWGAYIATERQGGFENER